jgi:hypothetical protein
MDLPPREKNLEITRSHKLSLVFSIFDGYHRTLQLRTEPSGRDKVFIGTH